MRAGHRSESRIVYFSSDVTSWMRAPPSVDAGRPGRCPACGAASRPAGGCLGLHGHGWRERQQRGPPAPGAEPEVAELRNRRYQCQPCRAVIVVSPRGPLRRRLYPKGAIALALALFGCARLPPFEVRRRVCPFRIVGPSAAGGWTTLRRWVRAVGKGALFAGVRPCPKGFTARQVAERAATTLAAGAPSLVDGAPVATRAFFGAAYVT